MERAKSIGLSDLLSLVRNELEHAELRRREKDMPPLFDVKHLDLELKVVLRESAEKSGNFDLKVVSVGGEKLSEDERTHIIKLHLETGARKALGVQQQQ